MHNYIFTKIMDIDVKIRKLREEKQIFQHELALQLGISQHALHNIETNNSQDIKFSIIEKLCKIFDKYYSYFVNDSVINNNIKEYNRQRKKSEMQISY